MADKISELHRINGPRVQRAIDQLRHIEKSANSLKVHELDLAKLLQPVRMALGDICDPLAVEMTNPVPETPEPVKAPTEPPVSPHVAKWLPNIETTDTTTLVDFALACAVEIAKRRS